VLDRKRIAGCILLAVSSFFLYGATFFATVEDSCSRVEKVEGDRVYIRSGGCTKGEFLLPFEGKEGIKYRVIIDGREKGEARSFSIDRNTVDSLLSKADGMKGDAEIKNIYMDEMSTVAERLYRDVTSEAYMAEIEKMKKLVLKGESTGRASENSQERKSEERRARRLSPDERFYVFVSSGVPAGTLRTYAADMERLIPEGVFVLRGFVGGVDRIGPTVRFISDVISIRKECGPECGVREVQFIIDPLLFRRFKIRSVPAFVFVKGVSCGFGVDDPGDEDACSIRDWFVIRGDASLEYVLEKFGLLSGGKK